MNSKQPQNSLKGGISATKDTLKLNSRVCSVFSPHLKMHYAS